MNQFSINEKILINQFVQGLHSLQELNLWFEDFDTVNKRNIIYNLLYIFIQAHPTYEEIEESAVSLKKVRSSSAVKLLNRNKPYDKFGHELCGLPEKELSNSFNIMLLSLAKADNRRKKHDCLNGCNHWWHQDLSNEKYLEKLRNGGIG